jgi:hypothetical protein
VGQLRRNLRAHALPCGDIAAEHNDRAPCPCKLTARDLPNAMSGARNHGYIVHESRREREAQ